jgi:hypothetical protein
VRPIPPDSPSSEQFPLWGNISIPVVGGCLLLALATVIYFQRKKDSQLRIKQIVTASMWKQPYALRNSLLPLLGCLVLAWFQGLSLQGPLLGVVLQHFW